MSWKLDSCLRGANGVALQRLGGQISRSIQQLQTGVIATDALEVCMLMWHFAKEIALPRLGDS